MPVEGVQRPRRLPEALSIGGLASSGGAGVSLDHAVGRVMGVHFHLVPSAVVAETPDTVEHVEPLPPELFARMLSLHAQGAAAAKASLLATRRHVEVAAERLPPGVPLVLDPVYAAGSGPRLVDDPRGYLDALAKLLIPRAALVTANVPEAEALTGVAIADEEGMARAAKRLVEMGAQAAAVKGGHLASGDRVVDVLYTREGRLLRLERPRLRGPCSDPHGGGCSFSAVAAAVLALGGSVADAFAAASAAAWEAVRSSYALASAGRCVADPLAEARRARGILESMYRVRTALRMLLGAQRVVLPHVPETGMNIAEAPVDALEPSHVPAVEGRIRRGVDGLVAGCVWPGASSHMARLVLALAPSGVRAAVNARPSPGLLEAAEAEGLRLLELDRSREPEPEKEGGTMAWIASMVSGRRVDVVYDSGAHGKEPMARFLGADAVDAAEKLLRAARRAARR